MFECPVIPQPLFVPCARPIVALRFEPLQVPPEFDMTVQPVKSVVGPPLLRTAVPLVSSPNKQTGCCIVVLLATAALVNVCSRAPFKDELP